MSAALGFRRYQHLETEYYETDERTVEMQTPYESLVQERIQKYDTTREAVERATRAFFTSPQDSDPSPEALADAALYREANPSGSSTLEDYLQFFADRAVEDDEPMRCRSCGFYPCTCGADERS